MLQSQDDRQILFVVGEFGGEGKTFLAHYLVANHGAVKYENSKTNDVKYAYEGEPIVIFDFVRSSQDHINYEILEIIKNGSFFSSKYQSEFKAFAPPKVVVFTNEHPDLNKLSKDRYQIKCI